MDATTNKSTALQTIKSDTNIVDFLLQYKLPAEETFFSKYPFLTPQIIAGTGDKEWKEERWVQPGISVYGLTILASLSDSYFCCNVPIIMFTFFIHQSIIIGMAQGYILYWLWRSLPAAYEVNLCTTDNLVFYVCIIGIFLLSLIPDLRIISNEFRIVHSGNLLFDVGTFKKFEKKTNNLVVCYLIVLYELLLWITLLLVGVNYILTSESFGDLVQAAVAITFLNELDDMAVFLYGEEFTKRITSTYVRCEPGFITGDNSVFVPALFTIPVILCVSFGIVFGLHNDHC